jgi:hypothetical protein
MIKTKTSKHRPQRRNRDQLQSSKHGTQETTNIWVKRKIRYQIAGKRASAKQPEAENVADTAVPSRLFSISALTTATTRRKAVAALCQTTCAQLLLILKASLSDGTLHGLSEHLAPSKQIRSRPVPPRSRHRQTHARASAPSHASGRGFQVRPSASRAAARRAQHRAN